MARRNGRMDMIQALYEQEGRRVFQLAYRLCGDREAALDCMQETFLRAAKHAAELDPARNVTGWLFRIARNVCIDGLRSRKTKPAVSLDAAGDAVAPRSVGASADARLTADERRARIRAALESLSPDHRDIIVLRDMMDLSYEDIAETLAVPPGTVMSRLHRARVALRDALGGDPHAL